jgi:hypothetical protein
MHAWRGLDPRNITSVARTLRAAVFPTQEPTSQGTAVSADDQRAAAASGPTPKASETATATG